MFDAERKVRECEWIQVHGREIEDEGGQNFVGRYERERVRGYSSSIEVVTDAVACLCRNGGA